MRRQRQCGHHGRIYVARQGGSPEKSPRAAGICLYFVRGLHRASLYSRAMSPGAASRGLLAGLPLARAGNTNILKVQIVGDKEKYDA